MFLFGFWILFSFSFVCPFFTPHIAASTHNQEDLFRHENLTRFDPASVLRTIWSMIQICDAETDEIQNVLESDVVVVDESENQITNDDEDDEPNYPDIIPRGTSKTLTTPTTTATATTRTRSTDVETIFLLAIFFGTVILLYLFPPADP